LINAFSDSQCESVDGSFPITSTPSFSSMWLMPKLHGFSTEYPGIKIRAASSNQLKDLKKNLIDFAIRFGRGAQNENSEDDVYPVCSAKLAEEMNFATPQDILKTWRIRLGQPVFLTGRPGSRMWEL
jgi:LysR family glycine cleavage system transcriptional activator